jgi:CMP-N-acetylneuraminic acid synthetase
MNIVAIIPARGGSKGILKKNIRLLKGKPLISYVISTAKKVSLINRIIVSTDDVQIQEIAQNYGAEVPFLRPSELARDDTPTAPVIKHAITYLEEKENYLVDIVVLLYPTSPLLSEQRIIEAINLIVEKKYDSVISVVEDRKHYWIKDKNGYQRFYPKEIVNRQYQEPLLKENGAIYFCTRDLLLESNLLIGGKIGFVLMDPSESVDLDTESDFIYLELLLSKKSSS